MSDVSDLTDADFEAEALQSEVPVLIDFWGPNCAPCVAIAPHIQTLAEEHEGRLKVVKMNVHQNMKTALAYKILSVPTFVVLKEGQEVARQRGVQGGIEGLRRLIGGHV
ncbi:MAG TPA: thiol reductase thioredoxin [Deltaproteobacteria bacterium]|nr:thiol reductase thioredoxin [Deltaproteobacteria bacterium]